MMCLRVTVSLLGNNIALYETVVTFYNNICLNSYCHLCKFKKAE